MKVDNSKFCELLNHNTENERNEKAKKAVHDNLYNKGFRDGIAVFDKIRAEIEQITDTMGVSYNQYVSKIDVLQIIDKYKTEIELQESEVKEWN